MVATFAIKRVYSETRGEKKNPTGEQQGSVDLRLSLKLEVKLAGEGSWLCLGRTNNLLPFWGDNSGKTVSNVHRI